MTQVKGQQAQALEFLDSWLTGQELTACLKGYAGTGKTWLVGHWVGQLLEQQRQMRITVLAPTNKALDVLRSKCGHLNVAFATVDSFLGNRIKKNEDGETVKSKGKGQENPQLIICDEGSMVKADYDKDLRSRRVKLLYVGDPAQLPPINEDISSAFKCSAQFEMTEVVRYDGAIIKVATMLRERILSKASFILSDFFPFKDETGALTVIRMDKLYDWACTAIRKGLEARIVAFTNADVNQHNATMHRMLYPQAEFFGVGEKVVVNETFELPKTDPDSEETDMLYNGEMLTVVSCDRALDVAGVVIYDVGVRRHAGEGEEQSVPDYVLQVAFDESRMQSVHKQLTNDIWECRRNGDNIKAQELVKLRKPLNGLAPLRHSYACTVHKSQGSTYDIAFCDWSSIYRCPDRARMLYVGTTRPSKYLVLVAK